MSAPLTVIMPTLNAATGMEAALRPLIPGVTSGLVARLIVSDGGSTDETCRIAREVGAKVVAGAPGRGHQIARGVAASETPWLMILHADTVLSPDWVAAVETHMETAPEQAGFFRLRFRASGLAPRVVAAGANLRARAGLPYGDQGLLIRRDLLDAVGGVPEVALMEDVILARRLAGRLVQLDATAHTSAERYERDGWVRRAAANLTTLARFGLGADPERLARDYARGRVTPR